MADSNRVTPPELSGLNNTAHENFYNFFTIDNCPLALAICYLLFAICYLLFAPWHLLFAICYLLFAPWHLLIDNCPLALAD